MPKTDMASYPFLLLKQSTATLLESQGSAALATWAAEWAAPARASVSCIAASASPLAHAESLPWQQRQLAGGGAVWLHLPASLPRFLEHALFRLEQADASSEKHLSSKMGMAVVDAAIAELLANLILAFTSQSAAPATTGVIPRRLWRRGSGSVLCAISLGDLSLSLLLPAEAISSYAVAEPSTGRRTPLVPLQTALSKVAVKLSVEISQMELTLGQMRTLAVGDVLALPTHLDEALMVRGPGGTAICLAHLGSLQGGHAVELIKRPN